LTAFTDEVVRICKQELELFGNGKLKEYDKPVYKRVGEYWDELARDPSYATWKGYHGRRQVELVLNDQDEVVRVKTGADGRPLNKNQPWSAAFISFVAARAGAGGKFNYGPSHSVYIVKALKEAAKPNSTAPFIARRRDGYAPKVGDLIACERLESADPTFDNYIDFVKNGRYEAHCDYVIGFDAQKQNAITVGGNVSNSVKTKKWPLDGQGRIGRTDPNNASGGVICIIENRL